jgi:hypothetical protein
VAPRFQLDPPPSTLVPSWQTRHPAAPSRSRSHRAIVAASQRLRIPGPWTPATVDARNRGRPQPWTMGARGCAGRLLERFAGSKARFLSLASIASCGWRLLILQGL